MPKTPAGGGPEDTTGLQARVERLELEAREWDARVRIFEARARMEQLKAANPKSKKAA